MQGRLSLAQRLEQAMWDLYWIPRRSVTIDRPELLAIGTAGADATLNAVYRTRAEPARLPALVDEVGRLHATAASRWHVVGTTDTRPLERALGAAGYAKTGEHDARVVAVADFEPRASAGFEVRQVLDRQTLRDSYVVSDAAFGPKAHRGVDEDRELAQFSDPKGRTRVFVVYRDDEPVSAGGINRYPALGIGLLWAGGTVPRARGQGAYSALVTARMAFASSSGLDHVGLYARVTTSSPIVAAQGFERCGSMAYWERLSPTRSSAG